jgi:hypothetical protein
MPEGWSGEKRRRKTRVKPSSEMTLSIWWRKEGFLACSVGVEEAVVFSVEGMAVEAGWEELESFEVVVAGDVGSERAMEGSGEMLEAGSRMVMRVS